MGNKRLKGESHKDPHLCSDRMEDCCGDPEEVACDLSLIFQLLIFTGLCIPMNQLLTIVCRNVAVQFIMAMAFIALVQFEISLFFQNGSLSNALILSASTSFSNSNKTTSKDNECWV